MAIYLLDEIKSVVIYGFAKEKSKSLLKITYMENVILF